MLKVSGRMGSRTQPRKLDRDGLWDYALRALGQRAHSASEIRQKLARRAAESSFVADTMERLREYGFTDDQRFSETFAATRLQNQGFGRRRVLRDLKAKRVPDQVANAAVDSAYAGTDEQQLIAEFMMKKYRGKDLRVLLQDRKQVASAFRRLQMAGFSAAGALKALRAYSTSAPDDWPEPEEPSDEA